MTDIVMDPVQMRAGVQVIAEQVVLTQETMTGTTTTCMCEVPRSQVAWIDAELVAITEEALRVCIGYLEAGLDMATRANQIEADQATVAATPDTGTVTDLNEALLAGSVVGGTDTHVWDLPDGWTLPSVAVVGGVSREQFLANNPLLALADKHPGTALGAQALGLFSALNESNAEMSRVWTLSRPGASYIGGGLFEGGGITGTTYHPDPKNPGSYLVD